MHIVSRQVVRETHWRSGAGGGALQGDVPLDDPDIWRRSMPVRGQLPRGQGIDELHGSLERVQADDEGSRAQQGRRRETSLQALKVSDS